VVLENNCFDRRKNEVLRKMKEERDILHKIKRKKAIQICPILRRNCLLKHGIEGTIEVAARRDWMTVRKIGFTGTSRGSTRSLCLENEL